MPLIMPENIADKNIDNKAKQSAVPLEDLLNDIDKELTENISSGFDRNDFSSDKDRFRNRQYIKFILQDILLAFPLSAVLEIGICPRITPLPNLPGWILGVSNIRGEIISIVDIKSFFNLTHSRVKRTQRLIIMHNQEIKIGILADKIMGIIFSEQIDTEIQNQLYKRTDSDAGLWTSYVSGGISLPEGLLNIIDVNRLLSDSRMNAFGSD
ncbi:chemotaxis protein CheW [Desulfobacterales bacterium HSG17]|nr:chemotaxis protein CheW [Desulfobacterales bacterium HSG17]